MMNLHKTLLLDPTMGRNGCFCVTTYQIAISLISKVILYSSQLVLSNHAVGTHREVGMNSLVSY